MQTTGAQRLLARVEAGLPVVLDGGVRGALVRSGFDVDQALGSAAVLAGHAQLMAAVHQQFCGAGVHVLRTNTGETTPQALQRTGYGYRAAKLSSLAVDLAIDAVAYSGRLVCVAGVLPPMEGSDARLRGEQLAHAQRLAAAGCDLIFVDPVSSLREAVAATAAAAQTGLPVLVALRVVEGGTLPDGEALEPVCGALAGAGARGFIAVPDEPTGEIRAIAELSGLGRPWGVWYAGPVELSPSAYAQRAAELVQEGATLLSGEEMVTPEHLSALLEQVPAAQRELRRVSAFPPAGHPFGLPNLPSRV